MELSLVAEKPKGNSSYARYLHSVYNLLIAYGAKSAVYTSSLQDKEKNELFPLLYSFDLTRINSIDPALIVEFNLDFRFLKVPTCLSHFW